MISESPSACFLDAYFSPDREAVKSSTGISSATMLDLTLEELPITAAHAAGVTGLPPIHRDPFDRLLIAQSITEPLTLLTNDALLERYRVGARVV